MAVTLEQLALDIHQTLTKMPGRAGKEKICGIVSDALADPSFVNAHLKDRPAGSNPREVLYEDAELGFCICGHVYDGEAIGEPHDHGSSWAIYGQATGQTEMTDWEITERGDGDNPSLVVANKSYTLNPGDVYFYDVGDVHSPKRTAPVKLLRIEGANLDNVQRSNIKVQAASSQV